MLDFYSILELAHIKAIESALEPNLSSLYRLKCREYSELFHTPLHLVEELDPMYVFQHLYEHQYHPGVIDEENELEELLDRLYRIKDPSYSKMTKEETEELVDAVLNKELERSKKKKSPTQETIQNEIKANEPKPKSGTLDFSDLERVEEKQEFNKSGFKP